MAIIPVNEIDVYCEVEGQGPPLLLIHGLGSSSQIWEAQVRYFSERYRVIAYDLRGHGRSSKPAVPYNMQLFAEDATRLLGALDVPAAHIIGTSLGGMIAFELAVHYPQLLKSLVVVNSVPDMRVKSPRDYINLWQKTLLLKMLSARDMGKFLSRRLLPGPERELVRQAFIERWAQNDKRAYQAAFQSVIGWSVDNCLGEIRCPVLVVASEHDLWSLDEKRIYVAKIPVARLAVIEGAHHAVTIERPEQFNQVLDEFLGALSESGG